MIIGIVIGVIVLGLGIPGVRRIVKYGSLWGNSKADSAADAMLTNPDVMKGQYDKTIKAKQGNLQQQQDAVSALVSSQEMKKERLIQLNKDIIAKENLKAGAQKLAKQILTKYTEAEGGDAAKGLVKANADIKFVQCQTSFKQFSTELDRMHGDADALDKEIQTQQVAINGRQAGLQSALREVQSLKDEKFDAVAEVQANKQEKQANDLLNGIATDTTGEELRQLREARSKSRAAASTSRSMAGLNNQQTDAEFLSALGGSKADDEFMAGLGLKTPATPDSPAGQAVAAGVSETTVGTATAKVPEV